MVIGDNSTVSQPLAIEIDQRNLQEFLGSIFFCALKVTWTDFFIHSVVRKINLLVGYTVLLYEYTSGYKSWKLGVINHFFWT